MVHVFFFPFLAYGHMLPVVDMAKLFASRGVETTIITTPLNAPILTKGIERAKLHGMEISLRLIKFPAVEAGLPDGCENADQIPSSDLIINFLNGTAMLQQPVEQLLEETKPQCLVADTFFPWATEAAAKFNIPRLVFHGTSFFSICASVSMSLYKPYNNVTSDSDSFVLPNLPHQIKMIKSQLAEHERDDTQTHFGLLLSRMKEVDLRSYGVIVNSFSELEPDYAYHYRNVLKRKAWHVGPVSLCNREIQDKAHRGKELAVDEHDCMKWLNSKKPDSVIYVCFGSLVDVSDSQIYEIAKGLEASQQQFVWVVRKFGKGEENEKWMLKEFEERVKDKGLIIRGWAPQVLILDHEAVGGFVTHCGWNSTLEGVCAGVPMVTWPRGAEQFYNEKLVTVVLKIGVPMGAEEWSWGPIDGVKWEAVETAVKRLMVGKEGDEMRGRAKKLKEMAKQAVEEGGSSYSDLNALIQEVSSLQLGK